ncbi:unnamed protein product, partial [Scytosiphon promiscuus]
GTRRHAHSSSLGNFGAGAGAGLGNFRSPGTDKVLQQLRTCSGINSLGHFRLAKPGNFVGHFSVTSSFDLACTAIINTFKYGSEPALALDHACAMRWAPIENATLKAGADFRLHMHRNSLTDLGMREATANVVNDDCRA